VSSSFKHSGSVARTVLNVLGRFVTPTHERKGWSSPPELRAPTGLTAVLERLWQRPVNTDEWNDDAPVFLNGHLAERVDADAEPDYRERRTYVAPEERRHYSVVGENNVGHLTLHDDAVVHRHLVPVGPGTTRTFTAEVSLRPDR
jgi:hypothetical protein